jgi:hypothetical protein
MNKQEVLEHLTGARAELMAAIEGLSETEMTTLLLTGVWTVQDILAHICGWAAWDLAAMKGVLAGEAPDFSTIQDVDTFNARLVAERSGWSLEQILAKMRDTQAALQELLARMSDKDLFRNELFQGPYWDNLAGWLQVAWEHEEEHAVQIRAWRATHGRSQAGQGGA